MVETETPQRERADDKPIVIICDGCNKAVDPLTLSCGCFHG